MKKIKKWLRSLFSKRIPKDRSNCQILFDNIKEGEKKGADIWGTDFPIPVSDTLSYKLLWQGSKQYVITSVESKILFFIPYHYYEYIIEIPWSKYSHGGFGAKEALNEINDAKNWNKGSRLKPTYFDGDVTFKGCGRDFELECGNNDYQWLKEQ